MGKFMQDAPNRKEGRKEGRKIYARERIKVLSSYYLSTLIFTILGLHFIIKIAGRESMSIVI
jgi:hypothetical protein